MADSQHRFIALLRAINVGGHGVIKMTDLRKSFEMVGMRDVVTHIQSGNVVFSTSESGRVKLVRQLETRLESVVGNKVTVFIVTRSELQTAVRHNPFDPERWDAERRCQLMFLSTEPAVQARKALMALQGEEYQFHIAGKVLYYAYSRKFDGRRRMLDFEKLLGVSGTSRSWQVVNKLIELSG